jgi:antitoxin component YwqK of YwqJK toxin-antitoxin module
MRTYLSNTLAILTLFISIAAESQNLKKVVTYYDIYKTKVQESYTTLPTAPYLMQGAYEKFDAYGAIMTKGNFNNGKKHGLFTNYFSTEMTGIYGKSALGKVWTKTNYVNDKENGLDQMYSVKNGEQALIKQSTWSMGAKIKDEEWTESGKQIKLVQPNGPCYELYENGSKKMEYTLEAGKYEGKYTSWYPDGTVEVSSNYKADKKSGKHIEYFKNGKPELEASYVDDKMTGLVSLSFDDGSKRKTIEYDPTTFTLVEEKEYSRKGILKFTRKVVFGNQTKSITYDSITGTKAFEEEEMFDSRTSNYVQNGRVLQFHRNGQVAIDAKFVNGKLDGTFKQFDDSGAVISSGENKNGMSTGEWTNYLDDEWNLVSSKKDATYYRKITYVPSGSPWPATDYFITGEKQFEGMLTQVSPDIPVGKCTYYFQSGTVAQELDVDNAGNVRWQKKYTEDGKLDKEAKATNTTFGPGAEWIEYYTNGKVKAKGKTVDGTKVGTWTYYDESGNSKQVIER